jgi:hypothetical protein
MLGPGLLIGVACAMLFFRAAEYERMSPWGWAVSSFGLSLIAGSLRSGLLVMVLVQAGLFVVMWWYNIRRHSRPKQ